MNKKSFCATLLVAILLAGAIMAGISEARAQTGSFTLTQQVRNLTKQNFAWANSVQANATDRIEFQVIVAWQGGVPAENVLVNVALSEKLSYAGNLKLEGNPISGDITAQNLNIGTIGTGQSKRVTFEALVLPAEQIDVGVSDLVNTATVFNTQGAASATALVQVTKAGGPTDVSTGPLSIEVIGLGFTLVVFAFVGAFLFLRSYIKREIFESAYETRADRKLDTMIREIQKKEKV